MNDKELAIVSIAFGDERYKQQLERLRESIKKFHPDAEFFYWIEDTPIGSRDHSDSLYGFKVWGVQNAIDNGFKKIVWLDPACFLVDKLDDYFSLVKEYGVVAAQDDNLLCNYCGDKAFDYFESSRSYSQLERQHLCGGSIYVFDIDIELSRLIFEKWKQAEVDGIFGSQAEAASERINSHRNDESCMSLALYHYGSRPCPYDKARYNDVSNCIVRKSHFK